MIGPMVRIVTCVAALLLFARSLGAATPARAEVEWLCKPGAEPNPCVGDLTTTIQRPDGTDRVAAGDDRQAPPHRLLLRLPHRLRGPRRRTPTSPGIRRWTRSRAFRRSASRATAGSTRRSTASARSPRSPRRQRGRRAANLAFGDIVEAWNDYLANYNDGRGVRPDRPLAGHADAARPDPQPHRRPADRSGGDSSAPSSPAPTSWSARAGTRVATSTTFRPAGDRASSAASSPGRPSTSRRRPTRASAARPPRPTPPRWACRAARSTRSSAPTRSA